MPVNPEETENLTPALPSVMVVGGYKATNVGFIRHLYLIGVDCVIDEINTSLLLREQIADTIKNKHLLSGQKENAVLSDGLIVKANTNYNLIKFPQKECVFSESHAHTPDGEEYTCLIEIILPRTEMMIRRWIHHQNNRRFVAVMQDTNGFWYQVGDTDTPLMWQIETTIAGSNAMKFVLRTKMWHPAWSLSNPTIYSVQQTSDNNSSPVIQSYACNIEINDQMNVIDLMAW